QLDMLGEKLEAAGGESGEVSSGPREACCETFSDRIRSDRNDDGNVVGYLLQSTVYGNASGDDNVRLQQRPRERRQPHGQPIGETGFHDKALALDVTMLAHALDELPVTPGVHRELARAEVKKADAPYLALCRVRLCDHRAGDERSRRESDEQVAALH